MYVYVDVLFLLNFAMNTLVFILTAEAAGYLWRWRRIMTAAAVGSIYAIGAVIPEFYLFYTLPAKLCVSAALVYTAVGIQSLKQFVFIFSVFYIVSFILGGAVIGWLFFIENGQWITPGAAWSVSWTHVLVGSLVASILVTLVARGMLSKINRRNVLHRVRIGYRSREVEITALLDSGNRLISPLSKRPVLLVERDAIIPILSAAVGDFLHITSPSFWLPELENCLDHSWLERVEPVPYQSVGSRSMLLGFRPDKITIDDGTRTIEAGIAIVGIYPDKLSTDGAYTALLHPLFMEGREITRRRERANQVANY